VAFATTFEHQAQGEGLAGQGIACDAARGPAKKHFTESLILAQDERWRRA
jgi:hypothetical protein